MSAYRSFRWIGSVNAFLVIAGGLVAGRIYDKGYLYVYILRFLTAC